MLCPVLAIIAAGEYSAPMTRPVNVADVNLTMYPCFKHALAQSTEVTLNKGDLFYLPPFWWHQVTSKGRSLAVNYWYRQVAK